VVARFELRHDQGLQSNVCSLRLGARERLDAVILAVAGAWDTEQAWALDGALSPVAWRAHRCPLTVRTRRR